MLLHNVSYSIFAKVGKNIRRVYRNANAMFSSTTLLLCNPVEVAPGPRKKSNRGTTFCLDM